MSTVQMSKIFPDRPLLTKDFATITNVGMVDVELKQPDYFKYKFKYLQEQINIDNGINITSIISNEMKGTFSFKDDNVLETLLDNGVLLRIERCGFAIARVYFVDDGFVGVNIPAGLVVYDDTNNGIVRKLSNRQEFLLAWSDSYTITLNGVLIIQLNTQRQWSVRSGPEQEIKTIEHIGT